LGASWEGDIDRPLHAVLAAGAERPAATAGAAAARRSAANARSGTFVAAVEG